MKSVPQKQIKFKTSKPLVGRSPSVRSSGIPLNDTLAITLVIFLSLVPIPLGGNRPFFWAINAVTIGLIALTYCLVLGHRRESFRVPLSQHYVLVCVWVALLTFLIAQALPLGALFGEFQFTTLAGEVIYGQTASLAPGDTLHMALRLLTFGVYFFLVTQVAANRDRANKLAAAVFAVICLHAAYGLLALTQLGDPLLFFEKWAYRGSATGTFVNRNSYSTLLAFGMVLGLVLVLRSGFAEDRQRGRNDHVVSLALYAIGTMLVTAGLVATQSRMGLLAGLSGCAVAALLVGLKLRSSRPTALYLGVGLTSALCVGALFLFGTGTLERLGSAERDFDVRFQLYVQVFGMIMDRPWLGFGGGGFEVAYPLVHALPVSPDLVWDRAHSSYLSLWSELGVIFGSLYMLLLIWIGIHCAIYLARRQRDWYLPLASVCVLLVGAFHSIFDFSLEIQANAFFLLTILALGFASFKRSEHRP